MPDARHIAVLDPWPQTTGQFHSANPLTGHLRQYAAVKAGVMRDIPFTTVIVWDHIFNPRFIGDHGFGDAMNRHRLWTNILG